MVEKRLEHTDGRGFEVEVEDVATNWRRRTLVLTWLELSKKSTPPEGLAWYSHDRRSFVYRSRETIQED